MTAKHFREYDKILHTNSIHLCVDELGLNIRFFLIVWFQAYFKTNASNKEKKHKLEQVGYLEWVERGQRRRGNLGRGSKVKIFLKAT